MGSINTNVGALIALRNLAATNVGLDQTQDRVSTGLRVVSPKDDGSNFSIAQGLPDRFARRIARNVQNILLAESNLWRVADAASGAGYVEHLTEALCEKAWRHFQRAMDGDWPQPDSTRAEGLPVIGTSAYLPPTEYPPAIEALR